MYFNAIPTTRTFENSQQTDAVHSGGAITPSSDHLINKLIDVNIVVDTRIFDTEGLKSVFQMWAEASVPDS
jgi:hypothetical protein